MSKHKKRQVATPAGTAVPSAPAPGERRRLGEPELLAALAIAITALHTWLARSALNPDGVSYLDLATAAATGDWASFVQGYWSPLYPALIALIAVVTGRDPVSLLAVAHAINGFSAIAAIALLWWWSRLAPRPFAARALIATFLLISAGLPRIEAVTPDVVLLALMAWIGYELLIHRGQRAVLIGLLLGTTFLAKTSAWPWLLLAIPLRLWGAGNAAERRGVLRSSAVCAAVMLTWIVPMSREAGHATLGSAGRLNYCWYINSCDSRTPDTHSGTHTEYHTLAVDSTQRVVWAEFPDADRWTYAPWSDPTGWDAGVHTRVASAPSTWQLLGYWGRQAGFSLGLWLLPVILGILLPYYLLYRRADMWRRLLHEDGTVLATGLLGLAGVGQFILVHSEPRLIAPFGLLFALALLHELSGGPSTTPRFPAAVRQAATLLGLLAVAGFAVPRLRSGFEASARIPRVISMLASTNASLASAGLSQTRLVILGPAIPVEATAFLAGAHIVAQVPPSSLAVIKRLSTERQRAVLAEMFAGRVRVAWVSTPEGTFTLALLPPK